MRVALHAGLPSLVFELVFKLDCTLVPSRRLRKAVCKQARLQAGSSTSKLVYKQARLQASSSSRRLVSKQARLRASSSSGKLVCKQARLQASSSAPLSAPFIDCKGVYMLCAPVSCLRAQLHPCLLDCALFRTCCSLCPCRCPCPQAHSAIPAGPTYPTFTCCNARHEPRCTTDGAGAEPVRRRWHRRAQHQRQPLRRRR